MPYSLRLIENNFHTIHPRIFNFSKLNSFSLLRCANIISTKNTERAVPFLRERKKLSEYKSNKLFANSIPAIDRNPPPPPRYFHREICRWPANKKENQALKK